MSETSHRKGHKRSQKLLQSEKEKVLERLKEMKQLRDNIVNYVETNFFEANEAAAKLLKEKSKTKFFSKYVDVTVVLNKCYARLINLNHLTDDEEEGSLDSSSTSSSTDSLNSIVSAYSSIAASVAPREKDLSLTADPKAGGDSQNCAAGLNNCSGEISVVSDDLCADAPSQTRDSNQSLNSCVTVLEITPRMDDDCKTPEDTTENDIISNEATSQNTVQLEETEEKEIETFRCQITKTSSPRATKTSPVPENKTTSAPQKESANVNEPETKIDGKKQIRVMPFKFNPNARTEVMVAFAKSPSEFWAQFLGEQYDTTDLEIAVRRHCSGPKAVTIGNELAKGLHCCAWNQMDDLWCRAEVTRVQYSEKEVCSVDVCHLDTGASNTVHPDLLRDISEECATIPAAATRCALAGVNPFDKDWSKDCADTFKSLVEGQVFIMIVHCYLEDGRALVELHHTDKTTKIPNVSDYLIHYKYASRATTDWMETSSNKSSDNRSSASSKEEKVDQKCNEKSSVEPAEVAGSGDCSENNRKDREVFTWRALIPTPKFPNRSDIKIYVDYVESPTSFFAQIVTPKDVSNYTFVRDRLNSLQKDYDCRIGPPVLSAVTPGTCWAAKCEEDGRWYRVRVLSPDKDRIDSVISICEHFVRFIDYGTVKWINNDNLRPLLKVLTDYPAFVFHFSLANISPFRWSGQFDEWQWSQAAINKFSKIVSDFSLFHAEIVERDANDHWSAIPVLLYDMNNTKRSRSINAQLVDYNLARVWTPNKNEESGDINDEFKDWNPMANDFHSERNIYGLDTDDPGVATTGLSARKDKVICSNFNQNRCNDPYCHLEHRLFDEIPMDVERVVAKSDNLMKDIRRGMRLVVTVSAVFNPGHFFVVLPFGACDIIEMKSNEAFFENKLKSSKEIRTLKKELNQHYNTKMALTRKNPNILYSESQLVAAKVEEIWYRARVLKVFDDERMLEVECVDYGSNEFVDEAEVAPLLPEFLYLPLQAVECFLANVEPVGRKDKLSWCEASRDWFDKCVMGKFLIAYVEYCDINAIYINLYDTSVIPNKLINDKLVDNGYATKTCSI